MEPQREDGSDGGSSALDPGMANERTVLAWTRTGLSLGVCAALMIRLSVHSDVYVVGYAFSTALLIAAAVFTAAAALGYRGRHSVLSVEERPWVVRRWALRLLAALTMFTAVFAGALTLSSLS